jgi:alkaline phosphatase
VPGNKYLTDEDRRAIDIEHGGRYRIAERTRGRSGAEVLMQAAEQAAIERTRLLGFFGLDHLPFRTADGQFNPTKGANKAEVYSDEDLNENPSLAQMARAALRVLETNEQGFWLMVEAGDVDWANHDDNVDNFIGAVLSGDDAFKEIVKWVEARQAWDETALIVTADHGHYFHLTDPSVLIESGE